MSLSAKARLGQRVPTANLALSSLALAVLACSLVVVIAAAPRWEPTIVLGGTVNTWAPGRRIPIPVIVWLAALAYSLGAAWLLQLPMGHAMRAIILPTLAVEAVLLLLNLVTQQPERMALLIAPYRIYVALAASAMMTVTLTWGLVVLWQAGSSLARRASLAPICLLLPVPLAALYATGGLVISAHWLMAAVVCVLAAAGAYLWLTNRVELRAVGRWLQLVPSALVLGLVSAIAFADRLFFGLHLIARHPDLPTENLDGSFYDAWGWALATGQTYGGPGPELVHYWHRNAYAFFVAGVYWLFGHNFYVLIVIQSVLGALVPVLTYVISRDLELPGVGLLAALLTAIDTNLVYTSATIGSEVLYVPGLLVALWLLMRWDRSVPGHNATALLVMSGCVLSLAVLVRDGLAPFPIGIWLWLLWRCRHKGCSWINALRNTVPVAVLTCALVAAYWVPTERVQRATGIFLYSVGVGHPALERPELAQNPSAYHPEINVGVPTTQPWRLRCVACWLNPGLVARSFIAEAPMKFDYLVLLTFGNFFDPVFLVTFTPWAAGAEFYMYVLIAIGSWLVLSRSPRPTRASWILLAYLVAYHLLIYQVFHPGRGLQYRSPMDPVFMLVAAWGVTFVAGLSRGVGAQFTQATPGARGTSTTST